MVITNFDVFSNSEEWEYTFDFKVFVKAYTKELRRHLENLVVKDANIIKRPNFVLLKQGLLELEGIVQGKYWRVTIKEKKLILKKYWKKY